MANKDETTTTIAPNAETVDSNTPEACFERSALPALRGLVVDLAAAGELSSEREAHYNQVITRMSDILTDAGEETVSRREKWVGELARTGGEALASEVVDVFNEETLKSLKIFSALAGHVDASEGKGLLAYASYMLSQLEGNEFDVQAELDPLGIDGRSRDELVFAFNTVGRNVNLNFLNFLQRVDIPTSYLVNDDPRVGRDSGSLSPESVRELLYNETRVSDGAYRVLISALDALDPSSVEKRLHNESQNAAVALSPNHPLSSWGEQAEDQVSVNAIVGQELVVSGFLGARIEHKNRHTIENRTYKAPIASQNGEKESTRNVQVAEIVLRAGAWVGETETGKKLMPGQAAPEGYFRKVVDWQVWQLTLDSADAAENFTEQLWAAEALSVRGSKVVKVLGVFEGSNDSEVRDASAFRIPIVNADGKASFVIVDRQTFLELQDVCSTTRRSFTELAKLDSRYKARSREERWAAFYPMGKKHTNTTEDWVGQERDFLLVENITNARIAELHDGDSEDRYIADQLTNAFVRYSAEFTRFQLNYRKPERYKELAVARLNIRGFRAPAVGSSATEYQNLLAKEMEAVAGEYNSRWEIFRTLTSRLRTLSSFSEGDEVQGQLDEFLANIDYELEIALRVSTPNGVAQEDVLRSALQPYMRTTHPPTYTSGLLLEEAFDDAMASYENLSYFELEASAYTADILKKLINVDSRLFVLANLPITDVSDSEISTLGLNVNSRITTTEAKRLIDALSALDETTNYSPVEICRRNAHYVVDARLIKYPDNSLAVSRERAQREYVETLLGRSLTPLEVNNCLNSDPEVIRKRVEAVSRVEMVLDYARSALRINHFVDLAGKKNKASFVDFTDTELLTFACVTEAAVAALSLVRVDAQDVVVDTVNLWKYQSDKPIRIINTYEESTVTATIAIEFENRLNTFARNANLRPGLRTLFQGSQF